MTQDTAPGSREDRRGRVSAESEAITATADCVPLVTWYGPVDHIEVEPQALDGHDGGFVLLDFGIPALDPPGRKVPGFPQVRVKLSAAHAGELLLGLAGQLLAGSGDEAVRDALAAQLTAQVARDPSQAFLQLAVVRDAWDRHFGPRADPPDMGQVAEAARAQTAEQTRITEQHVRALMDSPLPHAAVYLVNDEASGTVRVRVDSLAHPPSEHLLAARADLLIKASDTSFDWSAQARMPAMVRTLQERADLAVRAMFPHLYTQPATAAHP